MKKYLLIPFVFLEAHLYGQSQMAPIVLTSKDVNTNSVRVITPSTISSANLVFEYVGKTSEEIKAIAKNHPQIQIVKDGTTIAETPYVSLWSKVKMAKQTALAWFLYFTNYDEAKLAEKTLRGK